MTTNFICFAIGVLVGAFLTCCNEWSTTTVNAGNAANYTVTVYLGKIVCKYVKN